MKLLKFADDLLDATNNGKIPWEEGDSFHDEYVASALNYVISIAYTLDEDTGTGYYSLTVLSGGKQVGRIVVRSDEDPYATFQKLFLAAQAKANKIDDVIDDLSAAFKM
ncbi:hypothetical protein [Azospirillum palustre]